MNCFKGKTICISGITGFLGRHLTRRLLDLGAKVRGFSRDGGKVEAMQIDFKKFGDALTVFTANARDADYMQYATDGCDALVVAHAEKRVNICESCEDQTYKDNVVGAKNLFRAARINKIPKTLYISTDKAQKSITNYGHQKRAAEEAAFGWNNMSPHSRYAVVRYGNVWDSTDSVIRKWDKLYPDEPLLITHPHMTRFYISIDKAVDLILRTLQNMKGGELEYLKGMKALRVDDIIASRYPNAKTKIIGLRCKEKMHEEIVDGVFSSDNIVPYNEIIKELE